MITAEELFGRCIDIANAISGEGEGDVNMMLHETIVMACAEGTKRMGQSFGNVFSQVDYLCRQCGVSVAEKAEIQTMRVHSNSREPLPREEQLYDLRALCLLISAVFATDVPHKLTTLLPHTPRPRTTTAAVNQRYLRCIVDSWDDSKITVTTDDGENTLTVDYTDDERHDLSYLKRILRQGVQLNLLDNHVDGQRVRPGIVVVEPDFLLDISSVAACFTDYGHSPMAYTVNRLRPRANSQAILLGNFASSALDDIINNELFNVNTTLKNSFREQALQFCACRDFDSQRFVADAKTQAENIKQVVNLLFAHSDTADRSKAVLEPSFVCERLGLQGRADLMTTDLSLLVEQKSGKNFFLSSQSTDTPHLSRYIESHYVQLLLYFGVLHYNYGISPDRANLRLLYSKYPAPQGLIVVNYYAHLFREAIKLRNRIVAGEFSIAHNGFGSIANFLNADILNEAHRNDTFFERYIRPQTDEVTRPLHSLSPLEQAYYNRMATFVYREQRAMRVGAHEGLAGSVADLWNMPLREKQETGNIYTSLTITDKRPSTDYSGYDLITLSVPPQGDDFLPNFRRGDMVYLYRYTDQPDVRRSLLLKGTMYEIGTDRIVVKLNDGQQNANIFAPGTYAVEHGGSDSASTNSLRSLHSFIASPADWRSLLLSQREPMADTSLRLSQPYNDSYDDILLRAKQARDYFLLVGPPGTGKTSMALRFLVEEELKSEGASLLLTAYTNRAVDEICSMLDGAGIDFLRIGNDSSCDPRFRPHLMETVVESCPHLQAATEMLKSHRVVVGTTSTLLSRSYIYNVKMFSLTIVDEASQILEPGIVGLLRGRFILIGDHKQLPAVVVQSQQESQVSELLLLGIGLTDCRNSLFERLLGWERRQGRSQFVGVLRRQGRMHPEIAAFPNEMFYREERLQPVPCPHQKEQTLDYTLPSLDPLDDLLKQRRMLFLPVAAPIDGGGQKSNEGEAHLVALLLQRIRRFYGDRFCAAKTVGVIVPYRNQIAMIRRQMAAAGINDMDDVSIDTVERYQGSQRDVIIYSFTVTRTFQLDFLTSNTFIEDGRSIDRKLNVAITRARRQMIMVGCPQVLSHNKLFAELIKRYSF